MNRLSSRKCSEMCARLKTLEQLNTVNVWKCRTVNICLNEPKIHLGLYKIQRKIVKALSKYKNKSTACYHTWTIVNNCLNEPKIYELVTATMRFLLCFGGLNGVAASDSESKLAVMLLQKTRSWRTSSDEIDGLSPEWRTTSHQAA